MPPADLLDLRARPRGGQILFIVVTALVAGAGAVWLARALDAAAERGWWLPLGLGAGIAAGVVLIAMQGTRVVVGADRVLTYSQHGRRNLAVDLAQVTVVRLVGAGLQRGVGLELADPRQVRFLHKAGISPAQMQAWRSQYGVDLLLDGFDAVLAERLERLRAG